MLKWIAENEPRTYREARWALQPKRPATARLTGEVHAEPSDASATLLYDVMDDRWDLEVVSALGLEASLLAPLLPSAGSARRATSRPRLEPSWGCPRASPSRPGPATWRGRPGQRDRPGRHPAHRRHRRAGHPASYRAGRPGGRTPGSTSTGRRLRTAGTRWAPPSAPGSSLNWVREIMNATWAELYASADHPGQVHDPIFVPHLSGERTPYLDPALRGSWTGLSLAGDRASLLRGALEGSAFSVCDALDALLGEYRPPRLRLAGGGTLAAGWRQLLADVLGLPLYAVDVPAASGRALPSWGPMPPACSVLPIFRDRSRRRPAVAEPDPAMAAFHAERHARFRQVVSALKATQISAERDVGPGGPSDCAEGPMTVSQPGPAAHPARRTAARPPATTWARPSNATNPRRKPAGRRVR